ncbi:TauD/TfdA family dioxygenase [Streptacidiphilus sp. P02-A3a]|uniref:TauD/TfdA family dioxygenase n=1 Tax=Streptacidiphilus sp. P02-A3a TaxID=2704468 RepID=UPI0015FE4AFD|nr:TauD/TfdA family dioxygenase [Streptacidiphilus sp. P02-A3a]QMU70040.1 TauD/TfdA family dioxygenase [Streptacidiphilus sp. P02-A3a]
MSAQFTRAGTVRRVVRSASGPDAVTIEPLTADSRVPMVVRPKEAGTDLATWAAAGRDWVSERLLEHRALLFRGWPVTDAPAFQRFVAAVSESEPLQYRDRSTPRDEVGQNVYLSTTYPAAERIEPHNEGTYWSTWPQKLFFCCLVAPPVGGETPIADNRRVIERIPAPVRERLERLGVRYVRNYNSGFGLTWQEAYQTDSREDAERYAEANGTATEWLDGGRLRTVQIRPAVRTHPVTGEKLWFNHAGFFHISSRDPQMREALVEALGVDGLPTNTAHGDGSPIPDEDVRAINEAYLAEETAFRWETGDVMLLDNMTMAHARRPYQGDRKIVVAMTDPVTAEGIGQADGTAATEGEEAR